MLKQVPLLFPKLHIPRVQAGLVVRERLLRQLMVGQQGKVTLLSAPAGYGKTTLVSQWIAACDVDELVAWVALDEGDNDVVRFWRYVITACQSLQDGCGESALELLQTALQSPFEPLPLEAALTLLLNDLSQLSRRALLVLEDYHTIVEPQVHETLTFLLTHLPATLHLVITTRVDPPLPLALLRARNELYELRADELRFSSRETQQFFRSLLSVEIAQSVLAQLEVQSAGWAAGLRLAAFALQQCETQEAMERQLTNFSGRQRHLLAYFVSEVLDAQSEALQHFLLHTSFLERLTGSLCDAVMLRNDGTGTLEVLARANLFVLPLDGEGWWYRYHPLFAEAMLHEARRRLGEETLYTCYVRASEWYEQHNLLAEAIEAALNAPAFERVALLLERCIAPQQFYALSNERQTLLRWLRALPATVLSVHPELAFMLAVLSFSSEGTRTNCQAPSDIAPIETPLRMAEEFWRATGRYAKLGEVRAFQSVIAHLQGRYIQALQLAKEALTLLPAEGVSSWRGTALNYVGEEALLAGQLEKAHQLFLEACTLFEAAGNHYAMRATLLVQGEISLLQGDVRQASEFYQTVLTTAGDDLLDKGRALLGLAQIAYDRNMLVEARTRAQEAQDLGCKLAHPQLQVQATLLLVRSYQADEQCERALQLLHLALAGVQGRPELYRVLQLEQVRFQLAMDDLSAVEHWLSMRTRDTTVIPVLQQEQEALMEARFLLERGQHDRAYPLLVQWLSDAQRERRVKSEITLLLLLGRVHMMQQDQQTAWRRIQSALTLAYPAGFQRLFLDEGSVLEKLLLVLLPLSRQTPAEEALRSVLRAFSWTRQEQRAEDIVVQPSIETYGEPLSPQEQKVLQLLVQGCSNPEIATQLVVSVNTVKSQVQSIYRKLNLTSRKEVRERFNHHLLPRA